MAGREPTDDRNERRLSRDAVAELLSRIGVRGAHADALLREIDFPATVDEIFRRLAPHGISYDSIVSALGAGP